MTTALRKPGPTAQSEDWHAYRVFDPDRNPQVTIGASDAAAACGVSPYCTPLELYLQKRDMMAVEFSDEQLERMALGTRLEPFILSEYEHRTGRKTVGQQPMFFHDSIAWMTATPDAFSYDGSDERGVECKASGWRMHDRTGEDVHKFGDDADAVPLTYMMQVQHQMAVLGLTVVDLPVLFDGSRFQTYTIQRDDALISRLIDAEQEMFERIVNEDPPEPHWEHSGTKEALLRLYDCADSDVVTLSDSDEANWWQYSAIGSEIKALETRRTGLYNRMIAALHGAAEGVLPSGKSLKVSTVNASYVTAADVSDLAAKIGQVKRKGYQTLRGPRS